MIFELLLEDWMPVTRPYQKKLREKKQMKNICRIKARDLFKINSQIRDFDIITDLIGKNNPEHGNANKIDLF